MAIQQDLVVSSAPRIASAPWARLAAGFFCALRSPLPLLLAADFAPIIGAPVIAIAMGVVDYEYAARAAPHRHFARR